MNRIISVIFSTFGQLLPYVSFSNRKGFYSTVIVISMNSAPVIGVILFNWNPFIILVIYWTESAIIGFFNVLKMFIAGLIQDGEFSPGGTAAAVFFCLFFTFHYGGFMTGHGIFITLMLSAASKGFNNVELEPFEVLFSLLPATWTVDGFLRSQLFAIAVLFCGHLVVFFRDFIRTGEYNTTGAMDYMMYPYKRIVVMHITIIFGFFAMFFSGLRGASVILIWVGMKVITDLLMNMNDEARRKELEEKKRKSMSGL